MVFTIKPNDIGWTTTYQFETLDLLIQVEKEDKLVDTKVDDLLNDCRHAIPGASQDTLKKIKVVVETIMTSLDKGQEIKDKKMKTYPLYAKVAFKALNNVPYLDKALDATGVSSFLTGGGSLVRQKFKDVKSEANTILRQIEIREQIAIAEDELLLRAKVVEAMQLGHEIHPEAVALVTTSRVQRAVQSAGNGLSKLGNMLNFSKPRTQPQVAATRSPDEAEA